MFYGFVISEGGNRLLAQMVAGETLRLSRVVMDKGTAESAEAARLLTAPIDPGPDATTTAPVLEGSTVHMVVEYRSDLNGGLTEGFWIGGFAVYAEDPDGGEDVMIYYGSLGNAKQYVSAYAHGTAPDVRRYPVSITVTSGVDVTVNYPAEAWVTSEELRASLSKKANALDTLAQIVDVNPNNPESCTYATLAEYLQSLHNSGVRTVCGNIGGFPELVNPGWGFGMLAWRGGSGMWQVLVWGVSNHYGLARRELNASTATWVQESWITLAERTPPTVLALPLSASISNAACFYLKTQDSVIQVYMRFIVQSPIKSGDILATLPMGFRPAKYMDASLVNPRGEILIGINTNGTIQIYGGAASALAVGDTCSAIFPCFVPVA